MVDFLLCKHLVLNLYGAGKLGRFSRFFTSVFVKILPGRIESLERGLSASCSDKMVLYFFSSKIPSMSLCCLERTTNT